MSNSELLRLAGINDHCMTKEEFFALADKYHQGTCSTEEEQVILSFCKEVQVDDITRAWDLSEEEAIHARLLKNITRTIDRFELDQENQRRLRKRSIGNIWKVAASVAAIIGIFWLIITYATHEPAIDYITKTTQKGQRITISLSDGSLVRLNAESSITFPEDFATLQSRDITLQGEAFFTVAKDADKPFRVTTVHLITTVLGTAFNVRAFPTETSEVTVAEGKVHVVSPPANASKSVTELLLVPGEQARYDSLAQRLDKQLVDVRWYTAWQDNQLEFDNVALEKVAEALERYYRIKIQFENETIKQCSIKASFTDATLSQVLRALKIIAEIEYRIEDRNIYLSGTGCK